MGPPAEILDLVKRFRERYGSYCSASYNEVQLRQEFVNPFFNALGWDVANARSRAESHKEVIQEGACEIGRATGAPDYSFCIGGVRKFFVGTKKPGLEIAPEVGAAFQLRRYGWSAKLALSILTDFEEFAVYDCRVRPDKNDEASKARMLYLKCDQYEERWDEVASIFSRQAVLGGSLDTYAESMRKKRGAEEVDDAFLKEIEGWRGELAGNLALRNGQLSEREINWAVQKTVDRIVFLRICEDRGIEPYGGLQALLGGAKLYARLCKLFQKAGERYNSGLFHFTKDEDRSEEPDEWTESLAIDDRVLEGIIGKLYYPDSPYEFSVLGSEILGQVYEQFLGKVIRLTEGRQVKVEDKPEVKKAGGVYYTPPHIVDYIVEQTVGKLLEGKTPHEIAARTKTWQRTKRGRPLTVLDPACGGGSFLIGAYGYLLDWYRDRYVEHDPAKQQGRVYQTHPGRWRLTMAERQRILLDHIHGVDLDPQAVEVTKLSLLLKVLEGENEESIERQLRLFPDRPLFGLPGLPALPGLPVAPNLARNIKCGNSLIGPDFYEGQPLDRFDEEERLRINVFDWQAEFPDIMQSGGFDAVIGNPPYVLLQGEFRDDTQLAYFRSCYQVASFKLDTYHLFMEKGIRLNNIGGRSSMIVPANFLTNNHTDKLRGFLLAKTRIHQIMVVDEGVFDGISVDNAIFVGERGSESDLPIRIVYSRVGRAGRLGLEVTGDHEIERSRIAADERLLFTGSASADGAQLWARCESMSIPLGSVAHVNFGKQLRNRKVYTEDVVSVSDILDIPKGYRACYTGRDVARYSVKWGNLACLTDRMAQSGGCWDDERQNAPNKFLTRQIGTRPLFALDEHGHQCLNTIFMVNVKIKTMHPLYVLGVLNSKLTAALWLSRFSDRRRTFPKIKGTYLKELPIRDVDSDHAVDGPRHDAIVSHVRGILKMHKQLAAAETGHAKTALERRIAATDQNVDRLVYELYGLTGEEICIVEETTAEPE